MIIPALRALTPFKHQPRDEVHDEFLAVEAAQQSPALQKGKHLQDYLGKLRAGEGDHIDTGVNQRPRLG